MILEFVLINQETGEPIYQKSLTQIEVLSANYNAVLRSSADEALKALQEYKPKMLPTESSRTTQFVTDPASADFDDNFNDPVSFD